MRVTVLGVLGPGQLADSLSYGLAELGHEVSTVSDAPIIPASKLGRLIARKQPRLVRHSSSWSRQRALAEAVIATRPELVLAVKSAFVQPEVIDRIRSRTGAPIFNWYPDNPFVDYGHGTPLRTLGRYDRVVVFSPQLATRVTERVGTDGQYIPFGFDPRYYFPPAMPRVSRSDVAFVGQCRPERLALLVRLHDAGFSVRVAGPGWDAAPARVRSSWQGPTWGTAAARLYHEARVGLNDLHPKSNAGMHNMRTWEIPATATPMATTDSAQQRKLLEGVARVGFYAGAADLPSVVEGLINSSANGHHADLSAHTYRERCRELMTSI